MSSFTSPLRLEYIDGETYKVIEDFIYRIGSEDSDLVVKVEAGFETDFASVPRFFWRILPPHGTYGKAAVIHDYMYKLGFPDRVNCDKIFLEAMEVLNVPWWKRNAMYYAVRAFGWSAWNEHRRAESND